MTIIVKFSIFVLLLITTTAYAVSKISPEHLVKCSDTRQNIQNFIPLDYFFKQNPIVLNSICPLPKKSRLLLNPNFIRLNSNAFEIRSITLGTENINLEVVNNPINVTTQIQINNSLIVGNTIATIDMNIAATVNNAPFIPTTSENVAVTASHNTTINTDSNTTETNNSDNESSTNINTNTTAETPDVKAETNTDAEIGAEKEKGKDKEKEKEKDKNKDKDKSSSHSETHNVETNTEANIEENNTAIGTQTDDTVDVKKNSKGVKIDRSTAAKLNPGKEIIIIEPSQSGLKQTKIDTKTHKKTVVEGGQKVVTENANVAATIEQSKTVEVDNSLNAAKTPLPVEGSSKAIAAQSAAERAKATPSAAGTSAALPNVAAGTKAMTPAATTEAKVTVKPPSASQPGGVAVTGRPGGGNH